MSVASFSSMLLTICREHSRRHVGTAANGNDDGRAGSCDSSMPLNLSASTVTVVTVWPFGLVEVSEVPAVLDSPFTMIWALHWRFPCRRRESGR
jgi:hypothetical protein